MRSKWLIPATLVFSFWASLAVSQETTGSITGVVTDPTARPVPAVAVVLREPTTGLRREVQSGQDGTFRAPLLPPGVYDLEIRQPGFAPFVRAGIAVNVTERVFLECVLTVGTVESSITVEDSVSLVQSESATQGRVISGTALRSLPLATRNYTQLLALTAGVSQALTNADTVGLGNVNPNVNGLRAGSNNILMDGLTAHGALNNSPANIGSPALDFLAEFKVLTSLFSAEYGKQAGSVVNVVTRSGDNQLHFSLWEFLRNTKLNARNFFGQRRGQNNQNQFGFTVGGPIWIPRVYQGRNRTFFFFGYEGLRQRNANSAAALNSYSLPTAAQRGGTFGTPLRDPLTGLPCTAADTRGCFPNNTIPATRLNPISRAIMDAYIPLPNAVTGTAINYIRAGNLKGENNQYFLRGDHNFNERHRINVRYFRSPAETESPGALPGQAAASVTGKWDLGLTATQLLTANQYNELRLGWARNLSIGGNANLDERDPRTLGIPSTNDLRGIPPININGVVSFGRDQYFRDNVHSYTLSDNFTSIVGRHTLKAGVEFRQARMQAGNTLTNRPRWVFSGQATTSAFADFLLDLPSQGTYGVGTGVVNLRNFSTNLFAQDDFKVSRKLTLNIGLRYEYNRPPIEAQRYFVGFWPDRYVGPGGTAEAAGIVVSGRNGVPDATAFAPATNLPIRHSRDSPSGAATAFTTIRRPVRSASNTSTIPRFWRSGTSCSRPPAARRTTTFIVLKDSIQRNCRSSPPPVSSPFRRSKRIRKTTRCSSGTSTFRSSSGGRTWCKPRMSARTERISFWHATSTIRALGPMACSAARFPASGLSATWATTAIRFTIPASSLFRSVSPAGGRYSPPIPFPKPLTMRRPRIAISSTQREIQPISGQTVGFRPSTGRIA
jgi:hypothetical protein